MFFVNSVSEHKESRELIFDVAKLNLRLGILHLQNLMVLLFLTLTVFYLCLLVCG
jgi:hypothetical protein